MLAHRDNQWNIVTSSVQSGYFLNISLPSTPSSNLYFKKERNSSIICSDYTYIYIYLSIIIDNF